MFKNDRMMMILTGLVLAVFAGSMVQYGDRIVALMAGEDVVVTQDDSYSVRAGASQILDVLSNDTVKGPIVVLTRPNCGAVELTSNNRLSFSSDAACNGEVEFAYCVDAEGKCDPNAVKINVISVSFAQEGNETPEAEQTQIAEAEQVLEPTVAPDPTSEAPEIESFSVEMAPPALAAPSVTELVSPSMAIASIRRDAGGLNSASTTDQNIATQNSASINQTASDGPSIFEAPAIGGSSDISLGGSERIVASNVVAPSGLQPASTVGSNIVQLERGPEALYSLQIAQPTPVEADAPPLAANPELNGAAPVFVASAQTNGPTPDSKFSAEPVDGGPIALIALSRTETRGNGAGESLNVILTEPGLQSFIAPVGRPPALAPASVQPSAVSVLERGPNVEELAVAPVALAFSTESGINLSDFSDSANVRSPIARPISVSAGTGFNEVSARIVASNPNMVANPNSPTRHDTVSRFISVSQIDNQPSRTENFPALTAPDLLRFSVPSLDLAPAEKPQVLQASLPITPETPVITAPIQNSACNIALSAAVRSGANITLDIAAACKPNQMVTIEHSGIAFSVTTDAQGAATVALPAMEAEAEITVRFEDQSSNSTVVSVQDFDSVVRAGVSWRANMNLDLSAIEFGAAIGSDGNISAASPRDYRTSRIKGGGYLVQLGDPSLGRGALAEIYTLPVARNQQRGTIALSIAIRDAESVCGQTITAKTVRTRNDRGAAIRNVRFTVPACGTVTGQIPLPGAIDDIRVAGR